MKIKPIVFRLIIIPLIVLAIIGGVISLIIVNPVYWIITGEEFLLDKYAPFCQDIYDRLSEKLQYP